MQSYIFKGGNFILTLGLHEQNYASIAIVDRDSTSINGYIIPTLFQLKPFYMGPMVVNSHFTAIC